MPIVSLIKDIILLWLAYNFRGLVHYTHGSVKADMVLEKELRVLHLDP